MHPTCMSKNVALDEEAIAVLKAHKREGESYSKVIKRKISPPIRTFGDLEKALQEVDGPIFDVDLVAKLREERKRAHRRAD
jgi:predicted CopG family antitoxin